MDLLEVRPHGIYCAAGDFYIDPWDPVERAVITSAARAHSGLRSCLTAAGGATLVRERAPVAEVQPLPYGERLDLGDTAVSLHPAGHLPGSAQVRVERAGQVWVFAGDYRLAPDPTCEPFEPLRCHTFVTGAAFALPIFRWPAAEDVAAAIREWCSANREAGKTSVLYAAPLGQAQRVLARLQAAGDALWLHPEVERFCSLYRAAGIHLPANGTEAGATLKIAPPGWGERGASVSTAMVSGWMRIRGVRRRRTLDRGFVLSGQADWTELLEAIGATGAESVLTAHGHAAPLARWLEEHGRRARVLETRFGEIEA